MREDAEAKRVSLSLNERAPYSLACSGREESAPSISQFARVDEDLARRSISFTRPRRVRSSAFFKKRASLKYATRLGLVSDGARRYGENLRPGHVRSPTRREKSSASVAGPRRDAQLAQLRRDAAFSKGSCVRLYQSKERIRETTASSPWKDTDVAPWRRSASPTLWRRSAPSEPDHVACWGATRKHHRPFRRRRAGKRPRPELRDSRRRRLRGVRRRLPKEEDPEPSYSQGQERWRALSPSQSPCRFTSLPFKTRTGQLQGRSNCQEAVGCCRKCANLSRLSVSATAADRWVFGNLCAGAARHGR